MLWLPYTIFLLPNALPYVFVLFLFCNSVKIWARTELGVDITSVSYWRAGNWCHYGVINAISWWFWDVKRKICIMSKTNKIWIITLVAYTRFVFNRGINANKFKKITGCTLNSGVQHHNSFVSLLVFIALQGYIRRGSTTTHNQISHAWFSRKYTIQSCTI